MEMETLEQPELLDEKELMETFAKTELLKGKELIEKEENSKLSRRAFGKLIASFGATAVTAPLAFAAGSPAEVKAQKIRKKYAMIEGSPIETNSELVRFSEANQTFYHPDAIYVDDGKGGKAFYWSQLMKNKGTYIANSQHGDGIPAESVAEARFVRALESASWSVIENIGYSEPNKKLLLWDNLPSAPGWPAVYNKKPEGKEPEKLTHQVKYASRMFGADIVGIAKLNPNWVYENVHLYDYETHKSFNKPIVLINDLDKPNETAKEYQLPLNGTNVVVAAFAMNREQMQTAPSALANAAAGLCYSRMAVHDTMVAQFIRNMGYWAIPTNNGFGQSVPMAIEAGIGQGSRMGTLITPEYGPNVRLSKVITNMPLNMDKPIDFGVTKFCETCKKCARECPSKCITEDERSFKARTPFNQNGKLQWQNDYYKCQEYWVKSAGDCGICIAVCPFTKGAMWGHKGVEWLIENMSFLDPFMLGMDDALGYGEPRNVEDVIYNGKLNTYGLDPDHMKYTNLNEK